MSVIAYAAAAVVGLLFGLMRVSHRRVLREAASVYIEVVRGVPMLVILYYVAFVAAPALVVLINRLAEPLIAAGWLQPLSVRRIDFVWRAIIALTVGYSAFLAEIFRAGIEAVPRGQLEAALSLGMSRRQAMLRVVLPQAARTVLPPLGNDFVAMIKDSALVSVLGVQDIHPAGQGVLGLLVPVLRDLQHRRLPVPGVDHQPVDPGARAGAPPASPRLYSTPQSVSASRVKTPLLTRVQTTTHGETSKCSTARSMSSTAGTPVPITACSVLYGHRNSWANARWNCCLLVLTFVAGKSLSSTRDAR